jgi:hypothetical protein
MPEIDFKPTCGNCIFYIPNKDKHGAEGACICMPPSVVGMPARNLANQMVIQWVAAPRPSVSENHYCGQWAGNREAV